MNERFIFFVLVCIGWTFSLCIHEFAHALTAYFGGDRSVARKGYLTLNPLRYTHPLLSLGLPILFVVLGGIGLPGGAVYIDEQALRSRAWRTAVSLAGPAASAVMAVVFALPFLLGVFAPSDTRPVACFLGFLVALEVSAIVLNLLPVPPLDGFGAIAPLLSYEVNEKVARLSFWPMLVLVAALSFIDPIAHVFWQVVAACCHALHVDFYSLFPRGFNDFRFWVSPT